MTKLMTGGAGGEERVDLVFEAGQGFDGLVVGGGGTEVVVVGTESLGMGREDGAVRHER
ncbi:hypothetical protein ACFYQQ_21450 [Streptomyces sp. NPDC005496]|uniref:hypothetical protein n=1 Tax=Streptomyces sp. NPDC005496 TaxID=3364716 RepID=UPI0036791461